MSAARTTLEKWISQALVDPDKEGVCTKLTLYHVQGGVNRVEVHSYKVKQNGMTPSQLQQMFHGKADTTAQDLPGGQTFNLCAFYADRTEFEAFIPFVRTGMKEGAGLVTEPGTEEGKSQQGMRWLEVAMSQVFSRQARQDSRDERIIDQQARDNAMLRQDNMNQFTLLKDMLVQMATMDHTRKIEIMKFERNTKLQEQAVKLAPALINMVTGQEKFPQSTVDTAIIDAIADKLTPDNLGQISMIGSILGLSQEEMGLLTQRLSQALDKKQKKEEAKRELPVSNLSAEDDMGEGSTH